ncbi:uncharacterized protein LOC115455426 [Manduca sexta]|uniref:uncharacterized protein LOC115455426 n=1 Tax=Manduca sexta TaxID=7130 RepID=UPI0011835C63|nr:uncharacterized protein LOC115455426 [Manduca sexta]
MGNSMLRLRVLFVNCILIIIMTLYCDGDVTEEKYTTNEDISPLEFGTETNIGILKNIESFENLAKFAMKSRRGEFVPIEDTAIYDAMVRILQDLIDSIKDVKNAYTFLNAEGLHRIVADNFLLPHDNVRKNLLLLTKRLFEVTPTTVSFIPENVVDGLLDIFENEKNLALKAHALDVLCLWLPKNPVIQARVMKLKGLEPFYYQVSKLEISVVQTLLDLFNKILKEHISARNEKIQRTKADLDKLRLYQRIGLLERMSTPTVCNGLLNIFEVAWNFNNNEVLITVFEIITDIKQFCNKIYGGNIKAVELFNALLKYVRNEQNIDYLWEQNVNVTNLETVIEEYVNNTKISSKRDEL